MPSVRIRVDEELKAEAEFILAEAGISITDAIEMLFRRVIKDGKLPFETTLDE